MEVVQVLNMLFLCCFTSDLMYLYHEGGEWTVHSVSISPERRWRQLWTTMKPGDTAMTAKRNSIQEEIEGMGKLVDYEL